MTSPTANRPEQIWQPKTPERRQMRWTSAVHGFMSPLAAS